MKRRVFIILWFICTTIATDKPVAMHDIHRYMWAEYQRFGGNNKEAHLWYKDLLSHNPSPYAFKGYIHFLSQSGNSQSIARLYDTHKDHFKHDESIQLIFVQALEAADRHQEAESLLFSLTDQYKKNPKITLYAAQVCIRNKDFDKALNIINNYFNYAPKTPNNYIFHFLKSQIYSQKKDLHAALHSIKKSLKTYPNFDKSWLMYASLKEQMGHLQEAIKGYNTFLEKTESPNFGIQRYLMNLVFKQKNLEQYANTLLADKTLVEQALLLFKTKQYNAALEKVDACITKEPNNHEAKILKVQIYTSMHQYKDAAQCIQTYALNDPENEIWYEALHLLCRSGLSLKTALNVLSEIEKKNTKSLLVHLYLADVLTRDQQIEKAIEQHIKALALTTDNLLKIRLNYHMALLYYQQKKYEPMLASLEAVIKQDNAFLPALNLHAYYFATVGKNISRAQKLIAQVLDKDPLNPHYLDTQALILYKEKQYDKAHTLLSSLAEQLPHDATIIKHLAKVHYKLGNSTVARSTINQAIQYANALEKKECESLIKRWNL